MVRNASHSEEIYTTGDIARICNVAPRTAAKWFDTGLIRGGYKIPGSRERRIPRDILIGFLRDYKIPSIFDSETNSVIVSMGVQGEITTAIHKKLQNSSIVEVNNMFDLGCELKREDHSRKCLLIDEITHQRPDEITNRVRQSIESLKYACILDPRVNNNRTWEPHEHFEKRFFADEEPAFIASEIANLLAASNGRCGSK